MRVVFFASGGPGNFQAALAAAARRPDLLSVHLLVTDRPGTPSAHVAREEGIATIEADYHAFARDEAPAGFSHAERSRLFHDILLDRIEAFEAAAAIRLDLAVLAYRRIIAGRLLDRFMGRAINQHPADLAWIEDGRRAYVGIGGHARALRDGRGGSRTCTIMVRPEMDSGEILCRGPWVPFCANGEAEGAVRAHEDLQKSKSDWPSLSFALEAIASGRLGLARAGRHPDGCRVVCLDGAPQPYGGVEVEAG